MRIVADTNVLVRAATLDDPTQAERARAALASADAIVITLPALCEFVWVLATVYRHTTIEIAGSIRLLLASRRVVANRAAVAAGLDVLEAGGDFADAVIASEGTQMGGEVFLTFDRQAARLIAGSGQLVELLEG